MEEPNFGTHFSRGRTRKAMLRKEVVLGAPSSELDVHDKTVSSEGRRYVVLKYTIRLPKVGCTGRWRRRRSGRRAWLRTRLDGTRRSTPMIPKIVAASSGK